MLLGFRIETASRGNVVLELIQPCVRPRPIVPQPPVETVLTPSRAARWTELQVGIVVDLAGPAAVIALVVSMEDEVIVVANADELSILVPNDLLFLFLVLPHRVSVGRKRT